MSVTSASVYSNYFPRPECAFQLQNDVHRERNLRICLHSSSGVSNEIRKTRFPCSTADDFLKPVACRRPFVYFRPKFTSFYAPDTAISMKNSGRAMLL